MTTYQNTPLSCTQIRIHRGQAGQNTLSLSLSSTVSRDLSIIKKEKVKKSYSFFTRKPRQRHFLSLSPSLCNDIYLSILGRYIQLSLSLSYLCLFRKREKQRAKASLSRTCCCSQPRGGHRERERDPFFFFLCFCEYSCVCVCLWL